MPATTIVLLVIAGLVVAGVFIGRASRVQQADGAEEYRNAASLRGWRVEIAGGERRYSGTTGGSPWTARLAQSRLLWQTTAARFEQGALVIWPAFGEALAAVETAGVPKVMLTMAMRAVAKLLDAAADDAEVLAGANHAVDGPGGFLFRATDAATMREWLEHGAASALESEAGWLADREAHHLLIAVLWRHGLQVVTAGAADDLDQIARVATLGAALAKAARTKPEHGVFLTP